MRFSLTNPPGAPSPPPPPAGAAGPAGASAAGLAPAAAGAGRRGKKAVAAGRDRRRGRRRGRLPGRRRPGLGRPLKAGNVFAGADVEVITYPVRPANLPVTVVERGSLESSKNEDAYCQVEGQTTIIIDRPRGDARSRRASSSASWTPRP